MYGDSQIMFTAIKFDGHWWIQEGDINPANRAIQRIYGVKEHEPRDWFEIDLERAENVVRMRAWFNRDIALAWELGYCEARLSDDDLNELDRRIASYWDIPF